MAWMPWKKKPAKFIPIKKKDDNVKVKNDNFHDEEDIDDDPLLELSERIEIVAKDSQLRIRDIEQLLKKLIEGLPTVYDLKVEINGLRQELLEEKRYNRELIRELINKPAAPSAAALHLASRQAEAARTGNSSTAGPKGKLP